LVKLFAFEEDFSLYDRLLEKGIRIKRVLPCDTAALQEFIRDNFSKTWAYEVLPAIARGSCFVAVRGRDIVGFGCTEATARSFVGPCGTLDEVRGLGIYRALCQRCFRYLIEHGYKYAIVGLASHQVRSVHRDLADGQPIERSRGSYDDLLMRL
jgi:hypothetical protein